MIELFTAFIIKHFICDFPLQGPYQYLNKGKYGHPGGIEHSAVHWVGTYLICYVFGLPFYLAIIDAVVHYHIDWSKVNICKHYNLKADNSEYYWWLIGLDQMLHYLTYVGLMYLV